MVSLTASALVSASQRRGLPFQALACGKAERFFSTIRVVPIASIIPITPIISNIAIIPTILIIPALTSQPGVKSYEVSLEKQTADVVTNDDTLDYDTVLQTIKKTGKTVKTGEADGEVRSVE